MRTCSGGAGEGEMGAKAGTGADGGIKLAAGVCREERWCGREQVLISGLNRFMLLLGIVSATEGRVKIFSRVAGSWRGNAIV